MLPRHDDIFVLTCDGEPITLNFGDEEQLKMAVETINSLVEAIEKTAPGVKDNFGIEV